jgi:hypothetical protein
MSLLMGWALAFDPEAWLIWGRDLTRGTLDTSAGPSWKPLPVLVTTPFSVVPSAAPVLWLVVARAGAILAAAGALALAARLGGRGAGLTAGTILALSPWWLLNGWLGNSEGILAAAVLWAVVAHLDGRPRAAAALGLAAGLLRPEIWPFLAAYALHRWRTAPEDRGVLAAGAALWALLWLGPDVAGAGGALGASDAALGPATDESAANAAVPFAAVLWDAVEIVSPPALAAAVAGALLGGRPARLLGAAAAGYVLLVAVATQAGYAGNPRYLVPAAAAGAVLAGVGAVAAGRRVAGPRGAVAAALALVAAVALVETADRSDAVDQVRLRAALRADFERLVDGHGGAAGLRACGTVRTSSEKRSLVARRLDVPLGDIEAAPVRPGLVLRALEVDRPLIVPDAPPAPFAMTGRSGGWELWTACEGGAVPGG